MLRATTTLLLASIAISAAAPAPAEPGRVDIGSREPDVRKLKPKVINSGDTSVVGGQKRPLHVYELSEPAGARVVCESGKVIELELEPKVGMSADDFLHWNRTLIAPAPAGVRLKEPAPLWSVKADSEHLRYYRRWYGEGAIAVTVVDKDRGVVVEVSKPW